MTDTKLINIEEYDYNLPDDRIAKYPNGARDKSRLLLYKNGDITETVFNRLPEIIPAHTLLISNNSKVVKARIFMEKESGAGIEIMCLEPVEPADYDLAFNKKVSCRWNCLVGNLSKWKGGQLVKTKNIDEKQITLKAELKEHGKDSHLIEFTWNDDSCNFARILEIFGVLPIPPYLNRNTELIDQERYQTVFSSVYGSVAAPTAGLHFTDGLNRELLKKSVYPLEITLHVGAGTFKPVKSPTIGEHEMHREYFTIPATLPASLIKFKGRIITVGTTSLRTIESLYYLGVLLSRNPDLEAKDFVVGQWMPYSLENNIITVEEALANVEEYMSKRKLDRLTAATNIIIAPGYDFKIVTGLVTNFHQPCSTLLLLVSAFTGDDWRRIYEYALQNNFKFLSYGDASLLFSRKFDA